MRLLTFIAMFFLISATAAAAAEEAQVARIISNDTFTLADGRTIRLEAVRAPDIENGDALRKLIEGKTIFLTVNPKQEADRYNRIPAQIHLPPGNQSLQEKLLRDGLVFIDPAMGKAAPVLYGYENEARIAQRGLWGDKSYQTLSAANPVMSRDGFAFVGGKVLNAKKFDDVIYLNFGEDWREDFTVMIARKDWRKFRAAKIDPLSFAGQNISVRGYVIEKNGPMIIVTEPEQIIANK